MAKVDVTTQIDIEKPVAIVAAYAANPDNVPHWYVNIKSVEWKTEPPLALGSRVAFVATFMGRRFAYTYQVVDWLVEKRFVMRTTQGSTFPMETSYTWEELSPTTTRMTLRNRGEPGRLFAFTGSLMTKMMQRANQKDLALLKAVLESA